MLREGRHYKVEYLSPMANLANLEEAQSVLKSIGVQGPLLQARPEGLDWYNMDEITPYAMKNAGMPAKLIASLEEVQALRDQRAKNMQQQQAIEMMQAGSKLATPLPSQAQ